MPSTTYDHLDTSTPFVGDLSSATTPVSHLKVKNEAVSLPSSPKLISHRSEAEVMTLQNEALKDWNKGPGNIFTA